MSNSGKIKRRDPSGIVEFLRSALWPNLPLLALNLSVILIILVSAGLLLGAYGNHRLTTWLAYDAVRGLERSMFMGTNASADSVSIAKERVAELKAAPKELLDSNTVSFLFSIFSLCLITAGVYVLGRTSAALRSTETRYRDLRAHFEALSCSQLLALRFSELSEVVGKGDAEQASIRDCLGEVRDLLHQIKEQRMGIEAHTLEWVNDLAAKIATTFGSAAGSEKREPGASETDLAAILKALKDKRLTEDYDRRLTRMEGEKEVGLF